MTNYNPPVPQPLESNDDASSLRRPGTPDTSFSPAQPTVEVTGVPLDQTDILDAQMPDDDYVDLSYYMGDYTENGELGHEEHQLDLTNFDGDNDDRVRGENTLNRTVRKEGTIRRAITRKRKTMRRSKRASEAFDSKSGTLSDLPTVHEAIQELQSPPGRPRADSTTSSADPIGRRHAAARSSLLSISSIAPPMQRAPSPVGWDTSGYGDDIAGSRQSKRMSMVSLVSQASSMQALMREAMEEPQLELGEQEMRDINVMAEFARPGRPKVEMILREEVNMADGRVVVACELTYSYFVAELLRVIFFSKAVDQRH